MRNIFLLLFLLSAYLTEAKNNKGVGFYPVCVDAVGTFIKADMHLRLNNHVLIGGVRYLINPPYNARYYDAIFVNKAYANTISQRFMFTAGYRYLINIRNSKFRVYPFMEFSFGKTGLKVESYIIDSLVPNGYKVLAFNYSDPANKAFWIVNHTGLGFEFQITPQVAMNQQIGFSPMLVYSNFRSRSRGYQWNFEPGIITPHYAIGFTYDL